MKILHTADWHIGKKLDSFSRMEEQRAVLSEICGIADTENVDAVVVAGDLFDNFNPSSEATELLYSTLHRLSANGSRAVIAIAGNHDSPERIQVPDALAIVCGIIFIGYPNHKIQPFETREGIKVMQSDHGFLELKLPNTPIPLRIIHTPFANEQRLQTYLGTEDTELALRTQLQAHWQQLADRYCNRHGFNLLVTHLFVMKEGGVKPDEPEDEKPILHIGGAQAIFTNNFPEQIDYVALGHLHRYQIVDTVPAPIVYSSSPLEYSFAEANQKKFVVIVHVNEAGIEKFDPVELKAGKKLARKKFENIDDAVDWLSQNQNDLVELTIVSESYLEASDKKRLLDCHQGIIQIIPQLKSQRNEQDQPEVDLSLGIDQLFQEYFKGKNKGQEPSSGLLEVFREVLGVNDHP